MTKPQYPVAYRILGSALLLGAATVASPALAQSAADTAEELSAPAFTDWLEGFRAEAAAAGVRPDILDLAFANVVVNDRVLELNDNQPEFARSVWDYLDSALAVTRIENGRTRALQSRALLEAVEARYGVSAETIVAIWGLESSYGAIMGNHDTIGALATLAWKGRRTAFGREQLIGALRILQNGYADREELKGSWAGAMGQTQFIPTTYLAYAVDYDGDGHRNIWTNLGDVFASTANYLAVSGYDRSARWGVEIILPEGFDYSLAEPAFKRPVAEWSAAGVRAARGELIGDFDPNLRGRVIVPAGAKGPAFLVFNNFEAILKYNRSTSYALAVGLLSDQVARRAVSDAPGAAGSVIGAWPREDRALSLDERKLLQQALADKGFNPGPVDGVIGANTKRALREWQRVNGYPADGYASADALLRLTS